MSNKNKITALKTQAKALRKLGEDKTARALMARVKELEEAEKPEETEVQMYFKDGRVYFKTPYPGRGRQYAFSAKVKEAGVDASGEGTHKWDPKEKVWSFKATPTVINRVKQAIGDFFSGAKLVSPTGKGLGALPESTYEGKA